MRSTFFLATALLAATLTTSGPRPAAAAERRPNIVFILADDLGYGELGCYGQRRIRTPQIDRLAAEGLKFTRCYAGADVCAPSRCSLMTGRHTGHTAIRANGPGQSLAAEDVTLAEVLKQAGYETGYFGKYGLGNEGTPGHPNRQGFDTFFGSLDHVHAHFYYPYFLWKDETRYALPGNEGRRRGQYSQDEVVRQAKDFLHRDHDRPFFLYLAPTTPHVELVVPEDSVRPYRGRFEETPLPDPRPGYIGSDEPYATFAGMVSRLDDHVGQILALLKERGLDDETIVFFSSDNGPQGNQWKRLADFFDGNGPLRGYKGEMYEGGIRVPMIARWPGRIRAGGVTDHVCAFWDLLPTLAELAGAPPRTETDTDGISFAPTLLGRGAQEEHDSLYWEIGGPSGPTRRAVLLGEWKAVQPGKDQPWELYDLKADPAEATDVAAQHPDVLKSIATVAAAAHTAPRSYAAPEHRPRVSDFVR